MRKRLRTMIPVAVASTALCLGCAARKDAPMTGSSAPVPTPADSTSSWQKVKATFASTTKKAGDAVTPKAKVDRPKDPTALSTPTGKLGADIYVAAAKIHESKNDYAASAAQYEKGLQVDGNDLACLVGYGHLLDRQKRHTEATLYYERAVKAHPTSAAAWNDLGLCYSRRASKEPVLREKSLAALQRAVELNPEKKLYRNNIAAVLVELGREQDALTHLAAAHDRATAHYNLGYLLTQVGKTHAALPHFAEAVRINPQLTAAQAYLDQAQRQENSLAGRDVQQYAPRKLFVPKQSDESVLVPETPARGGSPKPQAQRAQLGSQLDAEPVDTAHPIRRTAAESPADHEEVVAQALAVEPQELGDAPEPDRVVDAQVDAGRQDAANDDSTNESNEAPLPQ